MKDSQKNHSKMSNEVNILTSKLGYKQPETENIGKFILNGLDKNQNATLIVSD